MNKPTKSEIVPGLLLASTRYSEVLVLDWFNKARGLVRAQAPDLSGNMREVVLPMSVLRWQ
jgi:hypothetical protein